MGDEGRGPMNVDQGRAKWQAEEPYPTEAYLERLAEKFSEQFNQQLEAKMLAVTERMERMEGKQSDMETRLKAVELKCQYDKPVGGTLGLQRTSASNASTSVGGTSKERAPSHLEAKGFVDCRKYKEEGPHRKDIESWLEAATKGIEDNLKNKSGIPMLRGLNSYKFKLPVRGEYILGDSGVPSQTP